MSNLYVILPCYNEQDNIKKLIDKWQYEKKNIRDKLFGNLNIILIDDGSQDKTVIFIKEKQREYDNIKLICHSTNKGLGEAIKTGIKYVLNLNENNSYVCIMDSDNTHNPIYVNDMIDNVLDGGYDCIIASRYRTLSKIYGVSLIRQAISFGARIIYSLFFRVPNVRDYTCGYRLYSIKSLKEVYNNYRDNFISENGFTCMVELLYKLHITGATFKEVPFNLRYDLKQGASKMKLFKNILKSLLIILKLKRNSYIYEIYRF